MLEDRGVSTLHFDPRPRLSFLLFFEHQTSHAAYFNSSTPSCILRRTNLFRNLFLITSILDFLFLLCFFDHHTGHLACHDARILLYEYVLDNLCIVSSLFRSIGSLLPIGHP
jgi:hypothetical protein